MSTRLEQVVTSRLIRASGDQGGPIDVWLLDDTGECTRITAGSDWCLIVESSRPERGYDLGDLGRIDVSPDSETAFERHVGEPVVAVRERWEPLTGRVGLLIEFESGGVDCDTWGGDLRLRTRAGGDLLDDW